MILTVTLNAAVDKRYVEDRRSKPGEGVCIYARR